MVALQSGLLEVEENLVRKRSDASTHKFGYRRTVRNIQPLITIMLASFVSTIRDSPSNRRHDGLLLSAYQHESECSLQHKAEHLYDKADQDDPLSDDASCNDVAEHEPQQTSFRFSIPRFSLAKLSIVFLAFATATDFALTTMSDVERPRVSLGSAALSSVTDTLSPILPFAGGLDLRRDDYWSTSDDETWFGTLSSVLSQVQDAFARDVEDDSAKDSNNLTAGSLLHRPTRKSVTKTNHVSAISKQQPFVSVEAISELTLGEVAEAFRYAVDSSSPDFNESKFLSKLQPRVQTVIRGMQEAVQLSRGKDVVDWVRRNGDEGAVDADHIDALKFAAAMRVFAEWRMVRQVPDGYKGFSVGMSLGHKDVVQNIVKMEEAAHSWLDYERDLAVRCVDGLRTPTLRELLSYEIETGVQDVSRMPRLKEKSAGMGLLWVRRQLHYQTQLFDNVATPNRFASTKEAVMAAYSTVYNRYHGWAVQKIFNYSFQSAPDAEIIFRHMNPHRLREVMSSEQSHRSASSSNDNAAVPSDDDTPSSGKDKNPVEQFFDEVGSGVEKFIGNIVKELQKNSKKKKGLHVARGGGSNSDSSSAASSSSSPDDAFVTQEMVKDAQQQIAAYLQVANPLLENLAKLFDDLNMDDPSKV